MPRFRGLWEINLSTIIDWRLRRLLVAALSLVLAAGVLAAYPSLPAAATTPSGGAYVSVEHARIFDSVAGIGGPATPLTSGQTRSFQVLGNSNVPATGVSAVLVDVAATSATAPNANVILWPSGGTKPTVSNLWFGADSTPRSNTMVVMVGSDGKVNLTNSAGTSDFNVDVQGYFTAPASPESIAPGGFLPITATRTLDTVTGVGAPVGEVAGGSQVKVAVAGAGPVPSGARGVFVNIGVSDIEHDGTLKVAAHSQDLSSVRPAMNYSLGGLDNSGMFIPLASDGSFVLKNHDDASPVHFRVSVQGYFAESSTQGGSFTPLTQSPLAQSIQLDAGQRMDVDAAGELGIPTAGVGAIAVGVIVKQHTGSGNVVVHRRGWVEPQIANVGFTATGTDPKPGSTSVVQPGLGGQFTIYNNSDGSVTVDLNAQGWFSAPRVVSASAETAFRANADAEDIDPEWVDFAIYDQEMYQMVIDLVDPSGYEEPFGGSGTTAPLDESSAEYQQAVQEISSSPVYDETSDELDEGPDSEMMVVDGGGGTGPCAGESNYHIVHRFYRPNGQMIPLRCGSAKWGIARW